uniref:peptidylprolyl isomerase n=1 Tax=Timema tahoe TaxID=61484 RepID=A0A7R9IQS6_9NEOP|nr:unnamed protein product [Timema tahoe]
MGPSPSAVFNGSPREDQPKELVATWVFTWLRCHEYESKEKLHPKGLVLEPGKRFAQTVTKSFHISMACLEINNNDNDFVPVFIDVEDREYIVCNLHKNKMIQVQLDLTFAVGDKIAFYTTGKSKIHLTVDGNSQRSVVFPIAAIPGEVVRNTEEGYGARQVYELVECRMVYLCEYLVDLVEYFSTLEEVTAALKYFQDMSHDKTQVRALQSNSKKVDILDILCGLKEDHEEFAINSIKAIWIPVSNVDRYLFQDDDVDDDDDDDEFETQDSTDFSLEHLEKLANSGKRKKQTPAPKKDSKKQKTRTEPEDSDESGFPLDSSDEEDKERVEVSDDEEEEDSDEDEDDDDDDDDERDAECEYSLFFFPLSELRIVPLVGQFPLSELRTVPLVGQFPLAELRTVPLVGQFPLSLLRTVPLVGQFPLAELRTVGSVGLCLDETGYGTPTSRELLTNSSPSQIKDKGKNKSLISPQKQSPVNKKLEITHTPNKKLEATRTPNKKLEVTHTPNKKLKNKSPEGKDLTQTPAQLINGTPDSSKKKKKKNKLDTTPSGAKTPGTPAKTLEGGVVVEELKVGTGQTAKQGNLISVYYTGRLKQNNKQFDSVTKGPGFKFKLGRNEVIRGWDIALAGMKVGGKRKVVIPPPLAYGTKGSPPVIPPNSALVFEVELLSLN